MFPAIFLDRDGVLIENRSDYVQTWSQVEIFPEALQALSLPALKNYKIAIVTNQSAVGRGIITLETAQEINDRLAGLIHQHNGRINKVYMCPHKPEDNCNCRKPKPGMFFQAAEELSLDLQRSWMIGDAWSDLQAGQAAGIKQVALVKTGRGADQLLQTRPNDILDYLVFDNLQKAINAIVTEDSQKHRS